MSEGFSVGVFSPKVYLGELSCNLRSDSGTLYTLGAKKVCDSVRISISKIYTKGQLSKFSLKID